MFTVDATHDLTTRHEDACLFLENEINAPADLLVDLRGEFTDSRDFLDAGRRTAAAVERAEALARGEHDPQALSMAGEHMTAAEWQPFW